MLTSLDANSAQDVWQAYLEAGSGNAAESDDMLGALILDYALPEMRRVIERRLRGAHRETVEDICGTAIAWLVASLRRARDEQAPVREFSAYVAGVAAKAAAQYIADRFPERARLRRKLRLLCSSDDRFFLAEKGGRWHCGLRAQEQRDPASPATAEECRADLAATRLPQEFADFAALLFRRLGAPVELNDATAVCAALLGIAGQQSLDALEQEPAAASAPSEVSEAPEWTGRLWAEIAKLPVPQRTALLLNLRLPHGSAIELLEELGVADVTSLAEMLEMPPLELAGLWGRLPLDDLEIAVRLGVTRQQVINLRAAARERLRRRTRDANITAKLRTIRKNA